MSLSTFITNQRKKYTSDLKNNEKYWSLSALLICAVKEFKVTFTKYAKGKLLDAGAGGLNIKPLLLPLCSQYISLDIHNPRGDIDITGDIQDMQNVDSNSFDTVCAIQVLEHIPLPEKALSEIYRVLKPGGCAIISVPHLSGLHEEPNDFYRYTPYGLKFLMEKVGFAIEKECRSGGLFSFLSHPISLVIVSVFWPVPVVRWFAWFLNKVFIVYPAVLLDQLFLLHRKFPANILIVGRKG